MRRRYKGKVFLFEKCIIYTEQVSKNKLLYRGHFRHVTLGFTFEDQRNYFRLYNERKGNQDIEFSSDAQTIQLWIQMLNRTMSAVVQEGLFFNLNNFKCFFKTKQNKTIGFDCIFFAEKKRIKESRKSSIKPELSSLQVLLRNTTPVLRDLAMVTISAEGTDSSSGESQRNTADYSNAETVSIKSGSKCPTI